VGGSAGRLQLRHAATALQTAKLPRSYSTPLGPGPYPFPLHPLWQLHASRSNGLVQLLTAISYVQAFTAADNWTSYKNWWRSAHEINGTRALILLPGDPLVNGYRGMNQTQYLRSPDREHGEFTIILSHTGKVARGTFCISDVAGNKLLFLAAVPLYIVGWCVVVFPASSCSYAQLPVHCFLTS